MDTFFKASIALIGTGLSYLYGGWGALVVALMIFVIADYLTGILAAATLGKLSSKVGLIGIAKKVFIFVIVAIAHVVDTVLGNNINIVRDAVVFFYLANELISILENGGKMGAPIPPVIRQAVEVLRGKGGVSDDNDPHKDRPVV